MTPDEPSSAGTPEPGLQPPGTFGQPVESETRKNGLIWVALAFVIVLGLGVLLVLPKLVSGTADQQADVSQPQVAAEASKPPVQDSASARSDAEKALQDFLHTRARLELANVMVWGEPEWSGKHLWRISEV